MVLELAADGVLVFVLLLNAVLGQNGWSVTYTSTHICALKGSTVDIDCSYSYPNDRNRGIMVQERFWFIRNEYYGPVDLRTDPDYSHRIKHHFHENDCTLRITDLRERDSAEYKFRFITNQSDGSYTGSPGVTLTVTDLQVKRGKSSAHTELQCHSSCDVIDPPSYVWYKNGQKIKEEASSLRVSVGDDDSSYSCAIKGHEGYRSAAVCEKKNNTIFKVTVSPSNEFREGGAVTLTCSSDANPAATYVWYKINGRTPLSEERQLVFSSIQPSDSGQYYCTAVNKLGRKRSEYISINVNYAPKFVSVTVSPSNEFREGGAVTLTCSSDANPAAQYSWYKKNGQKPLSNERQLSFSSIQPSDSGEYYCTAQNKVGRKRSESTSIDVKCGDGYRLGCIRYRCQTGTFETVPVLKRCSNRCLKNEEHKLCPKTSHVQLFFFCKKITMLAFSAAIGHICSHSWLEAVLKQWKKHKLCPETSHV
uniref:B-cell receptor CD22 n=1 Tax=Oreochromis aureus TaxID=47969 RepID=A0A668RKZ9_OREAU